MIERLVHPDFTLTICWRKGLIFGTCLQSSPYKTKNISKSSSDPSKVLKALMLRYLDRKNACWLDAPLDWELLSPFRARVLKTLLWSVPWGQTITYSRLAALAGHPGSARAVGGCMARNPWPVLVPCHRVVAAGRRLGGFSPGLEMKKDLIALEKTCPA